MRIQELYVHEDERTFSGFIDISELRPEQAAYFPNDCEVLDIEGEFVVQLFQGRFIIHVLCVTAFLGTFELRLTDSDLDFNALANQIQRKSDESVWAEEYGLCDDRALNAIYKKMSWG